MPQKDWTCIACGNVGEESTLPELCPRCGRLQTIVEAAPPRTTRLRRAVDVPRRPVERVHVEDVELANLLDGGFARGSHALVYGGPGAGKSRLALRWLSQEPVLWATTEMNEELVAHTIDSVGANPEHVYIAESAMPHELEELADECGASLIGFDSISELEDDDQEELIEFARSWAPRAKRFVLIICQVTKDGDFLGPAHLAHDLDYRLKLSKAPNSGAFVDVEKSRFSAVGRASVSLLP